eukprot:CAMPEP_0201486262 /NCGR_PEP_ID=MMETSP0151_2-20130828/10330_1 /ASSEMBLY_ACC=CAM_ASM_000257 /TAXON_ID=200890 /ORGANISM="Paramoeba atlantica, Strain 621/1 / CCAP 1560/9" /LENGTH=107 /DNA_ID=CAMNT_0047870805 /DNA_START=58 /DNA_END=381 /DNA_ORIENTATION=-
MSGHGHGGHGHGHGHGHGRMSAKKVVARPINLIFRFLQNKSRVQIMLYEQTDMRIEGVIIGFDEYMNLVLDDAEEVLMKDKSRKKLGRMLLKGDNITLLMKAEPDDS